MPLIDGLDAQFYEIFACHCPRILRNDAAVTVGGNHAQFQSGIDPDNACRLDEAMTKIPLEQATPGIKAALAEYILKTAAAGQTSYEGLLSAASEQIQTLLSTMT